MLDPFTLPEWPEKQGIPSGARIGPLGFAFELSFSFREKWNSHANERLSPEADPLFHFKESVLAIARGCDQCFAEKTPTPRFSLQDAAQTQLIFLDVVGYKKIGTTEARGEGAGGGDTICTLFVISPFDALTVPKITQHQLSFHPLRFKRDPPAASNRLMCKGSRRAVLTDNCANCPGTW